MPRADDAFVRFEGVTKSYDGVHLVVDHLDLEIARGEFLTLLGPSGSGKTTCLMMLAGFEQPTAGEIRLEGRPLSRVPPHRRDIGVVFQSYALFPHMTVAENLAFPLEVRRLGRAEIEERVRRALAMVRLSGFEHRRPAQLSGGQQQRVALARALVFEPKLVLMDEPLGALDKQLRESMQYEIAQLHEQLGLTVVYVTHDQSEALTMSDRVAVFEAGRIQQLATPRELYEEPKNAFVARFIGENNRFRGIVEGIEGGVCRVRVGEAEVRALAVNVAGIGKPTTLSLRPERVVTGEAAHHLPNRFAGRLLETVYHGDHLRLRLALLGSDAFIVKLPNRPGMADTLARGTELVVGWRVEDCRALDA
ncbi:Spermidine/putrescine import ATP-binding protein PotA [bacterium HR40]|nr:Spermidine/putrescine import ATP-binding protein PotA [bacterium HR40]